MKTPNLQIWCHCLHSTIFLHQHQLLPVAQEDISNKLRHEWLIKVKVSILNQNNGNITFEYKTHPHIIVF